MRFMLETLASAVFLKNSGSLSELGFFFFFCKFHLLSVCYTLTLVSLFFLPFIPPAQNLPCISSQVQASRLQLSNIGPGVKASSLRDSRHARNFSFLITNTLLILPTFNAFGKVRAGTQEGEVVLYFSHSVSSLGISF